MIGGACDKDGIPVLMLQYQWTPTEITEPADVTFVTLSPVRTFPAQTTPDSGVISITRWLSSIDVLCAPSDGWDKGG